MMVYKDSGDVELLVRIPVAGLHQLGKESGELAAHNMLELTHFLIPGVTGGDPTAAACIPNICI